MDGTDVLYTELLHVAGDVHAVLDACLEFVENADSIASYLTQQLQIALRVERRVNAYTLAASLGSLTDVV